MDVIFWAAATVALIAGSVALLVPKLDALAWPSALLFVSLGLASAALAQTGHSTEWSRAASHRAAFALFLLAAASGQHAVVSLLYGSWRRFSRSARFLTSAGWVLAGTLAVLIGVFSVTPAEPTGLGSIPLEYASGLYLLLVSVASLAGIERALRGAEERIRWEIKLYCVALALVFGTGVYLASKALLRARIPEETMHAVPLAVLVAAILFLWFVRRRRGSAPLVVSQRLTYSAVTLIAVGLYLLVASLLSGWLEHVLPPGLDVHALLFLLLGAVVSLFLLSASVRHRLRRWLRRHFFSGRYDYRTFWLEATDSIRDCDSPETAAQALARLVERALDAVEVTVWLRTDDGADLELAAKRGLPDSQGELETLHLPTSLVEGYSGPTAVTEALAQTAPEPLSSVLRVSRAAVLVPLSSGGQLLGCITVGRDRSGHAYDADAFDFLGVLSAHAASEFHKARLLKAQLRAKEDEAFRSFATFLLHDLKNFASTLAMIAQNAERHASDPRFHRDAFASVRRTAERMRRLCNSLRTFSGAVAADKRPCDINELVRSAVRDFDPGGSLRIELELSEVPSAELDPEEVRRLLQNLVLNALEASPDGVRVLVRTRLEGPWILLSIEDDGPGIPEDILKTALFEPFRTTKSDGLGIGLFQCRKIVEAHGGKISLKSAAGCGTRVEIRFPAAEGAQQSAATQTRNPAVSQGPACEP